MATLFCGDFPQDAECCGSCHRDERGGFGDLVEIAMASGATAYVCCAKAQSIGGPEWYKTYAERTV